MSHYLAQVGPELTIPLPLPPPVCLTTLRFRAAGLYWEESNPLSACMAGLPRGLGADQGALHMLMRPSHAALASGVLQPCPSSLPPPRCLRISLFLSSVGLMSCAATHLQPSPCSLAASEVAIGSSVPPDGPALSEASWAGSPLDPAMAS